MANNSIHNGFLLIIKKINIQLFGIGIFYSWIDFVHAFISEYKITQLAQLLVSPPIKHERKIKFLFEMKWFYYKRFQWAEWLELDWRSEYKISGIRVSHNLLFGLMLLRLNIISIHCYTNNKTNRFYELNIEIISFNVYHNLHCLLPIQIEHKIKFHLIFLPFGSLSKK
jgi:hypothetical protein